jgi:hypothetical protein
LEDDLRRLRIHLVEHLLQDVELLPAEVALLFS